MKSKPKYITIFNKNIFEFLYLILYSWINNIEILAIGGEVHSCANAYSKKIFFLRGYAEKKIKKYEEKKLGLLHKRLFYDMHKDTVNATLRFYEQEIAKNAWFIKYHNKVFKTGKFETYIKKKLSLEIYLLLKQLHTVQLFGLDKEKDILIIDNPLNKFVVDYMGDRYDRGKIKWIKIHASYALINLFCYYMWLFKEFITRGIVFNKKRKHYKLSKEAIWGFSQDTKSDDLIIDNDKSKIKDILMLRVLVGGYRDKAFEEAKKRGFDVAELPKLKINLNRNFFNLLYSYFFVVSWSYFKLLLGRQLYLFWHIVLFYRRSFGFELLMNLYNIKRFVSSEFWNGVLETIVFNKYDAETATFHASDLTFVKGSYICAFTAYDTYYVWGDIHYDYLFKCHYSGKKVNIGCIYKKAYSKAERSREEIFRQIPGLKKDKKVIAFFDQGFDNSGFCTEDFFLKYLGLVEEFCRKNRDLNILLKPKASMEIYKAAMSDNGRKHYGEMLGRLKGYANFSYIDHFKRRAEEIIAVSDICISMNMGTPVTLALLFGKNALYFKDTDYTDNLFAKDYKDVLIFEDENLLFEQINNILNGYFHCSKVVESKIIRQYDAFDDDNALERMKDSLCESMLS